MCTSIARQFIGVRNQGNYMAPTDNLRNFDPGKFANRHIGPNEDEVNAMLAALQVASLTELISRVVPSSILKSPSLKTESLSLTRTTGIA
jgi:hypothetical protein